MNTRKRLTASKIIGQKIECVYEKKIAKIQRYQFIETFVRLSNNSLFVLNDLDVSEKNASLDIFDCDYDESFVQVLSIEQEPNLNSPIKSIIFREGIDVSMYTAILLENEFILTIGIGEFFAKHLFYEPSVEFKGGIPLKIAC